MVDQVAASAESGGSVNAKWPTMLQELSDVLADYFQRRGSEKAKAQDEAKGAVLAIAKYLGGRQIYLPTGRRILLALRDQEIHRRFNGANKLELAAEYGITVRSVELISKAQIALARQSRTGDAEQ